MDGDGGGERQRERGSRDATHCAQQLPSTLSDQTREQTPGSTSRSPALSLHTRPASVTAAKQREMSHH